MKVEDLVWPADTSKFPHDIGDIRRVYQELGKRYFPIKELITKPPDPRVVKLVNKILPALFDMKDEGKLPWIVLVCPNTELMQTFAQVIPTVHSLTTGKSSEVIDTGLLLSIFYDRYEGWDDPQDRFGEFQSAGLLVWTNVDGVIAGADKQSGRYMELLGTRTQNKRPTIFTACSDDADPDQTYKRIEKALGIGPKTAISYASKYVFIEVEQAVPGSTVWRV